MLLAHRTYCKSIKGLEQHCPMEMSAKCVILYFLVATLKIKTSR